MSCRIAGTTLLLESPLANNPKGASGSLALRAGDILVATAAPKGLSVRRFSADESPRLKIEYE